MRSSGASSLQPQRRLFLLGRVVSRTFPRPPGTLPDADLASSTAWVILGTAVAKSVLTALASYVMRLKVAPAEETAEPGGGI